jgi:acetaldehyde dehydrogenase (acetylating)
LNLKEKPLVIMDTTYWVYVNKSEDEIEKDLKSLISATAKYNGECVVLWHNSNIEQHKVWDVFVKVLAEVV